jgi:hypothetical protein
VKRRVEERPRARSPKAGQTDSPVRLRRALHESIEREIGNRIRRHQRALSRLRATTGVSPRVAPPLILLAHGDSWFDYPLDGNRWPSANTDIIAQLADLGLPPPRILNISHYGDATTDELALSKQQRLIAVLSESANWLTGKPDAILFSGGGNDIVGEQFCIYLNDKGASAPALDPDRFSARLASIRASYSELFLFRDRYAPGVPILGHCYDYARPMWRHPPCAGPWIIPSLKFAGWTAAEGLKIVHAALDEFKAMLLGLAGSTSGFTVIPTQGVLTKTDWANELHPYPPGFKSLAEVFLTALRDRFPGRV